MELADSINIVNNTIVECRTEENMDLFKAYKSCFCLIKYRLLQSDTFGVIQESRKNNLIIISSICLPENVTLFSLTAINFIRAISTVVVMVTAPSSRDALVVTTPKLRLGALSVQRCTHGGIFIRIITTIVVKVTAPTHWNTATISTMEIT